MNDAFQEGIRLFNEGHYWHAHEQWEACWLAAEGDEALFYKAIIQTAAALVKWQQGNLHGMRLNWQKSLRKLERLPPHYAGIDLAALRPAMEQLLLYPDSAAPKI